MHITEIFKLLDDASGSNEKLQILTDNADNDDLKTVFKYANDPFIRFYVKSERIVPGEIDLESFYEASEYTFSEALQMLDKVIAREVTGNAAIAYISDIITGLSADEADILKRVIDKKLRCGIKARQANKVWTGLVQEMPLLKCFDSTKDFEAVANMPMPAYAQMKVDAARCVAVKYNDRIELLSSGGNLFQHLTKLTDELDTIMEVGDQIDGELWFGDLPRKKSNGIANKSVKGTIKPHEASDVKFIVWDKLENFDMFHTNKVDTPYITRFNDIHCLITENLEHIELVEYEMVYSFDEANAFLDRMYARGLEGMILKNLQGPWEFKRSKHAIKYKKVQEAEFEIVRVNPGERGGRNEHRMGDVEVQSADGLITCSVGGGYSDKDRDWFWENREDLERERRIMTVRYSERIDNSLFLPRYVELRFDKDEADTVDRIP